MRARGTKGDRRIRIETFSDNDHRTRVRVTCDSVTFVETIFHAGGMVSIIESAARP